MEKKLKVGILAAGEGTRLKEIEDYKPFLKIMGHTLIDIIIKNFRSNNLKDITVSFHKNIKKDHSQNRSIYLRQNKIKSYFMQTPSSMHTLYETLKKIEWDQDHHIIISMVDTLLSEKSLKNFIKQCKDLKDDESALLVTPYIEDEKPLTLSLDESQYINHFNVPIEKKTLITSGLYCFSKNTIPILNECIKSGHEKLRNFLSQLLIKKHRIKGIITDKTIDVDRPCDIRSAENFLINNCHLRESNEESSNFGNF